MRDVLLCKAEITGMKGQDGVKEVSRLCRTVKVGGVLVSTSIGLGEFVSGPSPSACNPIG